MAGAIDATLRKFHASLNVSDLRPLDRVLPRAARRRAGQGPIGLRQVRSGGAAARPVADSRPPRRRRQPQSRRAARAKRRGARRDPAPPRGRRAATPSARTASSAVTRGRRSSGSPIRTARSGRSTSFTTTSTITAAPRRLASEPLRVETASVAGAARVGTPAPRSDSRRAFRTTTTRCTRCASKGRSTSHRDADNRAGAAGRVVAGAAPGGADLPPRPGWRSPEPIGSGAAGPGRGGPARAGDERRRRRARSRRLRRDSDREALADGVLRRRRRADARAADRGAQARPPAEGGDASGGVSRTDGPGHRRLRQRVSSRRADAAQRPRLAGAVEERREQRVPVPAA